MNNSMTPGPDAQGPDLVLAKVLGVRIHEVPGLTERVIYCQEQGVAFLRAGLEGDALASTADWLLSEVLDQLAEETR